MGERVTKISTDIRNEEEKGVDKSDLQADGTGTIDGKVRKRQIKHEKYHIQ